MKDGRERQDARERLARLAWLLDSSIPVPGTPFTIGLDALIGLFPVAGDLAGVLLSGYIIREAAALGASKSILARMALNVAVEGLVGMIPFAGDLFDAAFKANQRNVRLLNAYLDQPVRTRRASRSFLLGLSLALLGLVLAIVVLGTLLVRWIWSWF
ncbi:MAG TPA: DUF4112 domain-containing protein [Burkholderiales bacterium]